MSKLSLLGLANRARKVVSGEDLVVKEIRHSRAKLVLLADDASANTEKKVTDKCRHYDVPVKKVGDRVLLSEVSVDPTGKKNGRGAYLTLDKDVILTAKKRNSLANQLQAQIDDQIFDELLELAEKENR
ncbi:DUF448 domain-containing protein [Bacillus licheniformis]|nr:DUF448 domain-containing protein [Bacillus licheniformis]